MRPKRIILLSFCVMLVAVTAYTAEIIRQTINLTLPQLNWVLQIEAPDFILKDKEVTESGTKTMFFAANEKTGVVMSAFLEKAAHKGDARECRSYYWERGKKSPTKKDDFAVSEAGEMAILEYIVKEAEGEKINQKNLNAYLSRDDYWIDIHLSKVKFKPDEEVLFKEILNRIKFRDKFPPSNSKSNRHYSLPEHGSITLAVPQSWYEEIRRPPDNLPPTIIFKPESGDDFSILMTPTWHAKQLAGFNSPEKIKPLIEQQGKKLLAGAVEKELTVKELRGTSGTGYYYSFTDKAPKAGEYTFMTQGAVGIADLLISFTILTNMKDSPAEKDALDALRKITRHKGEQKPKPERVLECGKCGKTFNIGEGDAGGKCPHCGACWKTGAKDAQQKEIIKKCSCSMTNFKLAVVIAYAAGFDLKERIDSYDLYKCSLGNWEIIAKN